MLTVYLQKSSKTNTVIKPNTLALSDTSEGASCFVAEGVGLGRGAEVDRSFRAIWEGAIFAARAAWSGVWSASHGRGSFPFGALSALWTSRLW